MGGSDFTDRWRGAMLGTALGDAVGAPFEGQVRVAASQVHAWIEDDAPLTWTDDTAMTIGLAHSLIDRGGHIDPQHLGDRFAADFRAEPWRGYGAGPPAIFAAAARGTPYLEAAADMFGGTGSYGNGAAMRAVPAAIVAAGDLDEVAEIARAQARVTHAHPLGQDGAALLATAVAVLASPHDTAPAIALGRLAERLHTPQMRRALASAVALGDDPDPAEIASTVGSGIAAVEAVPAAVAAFLGAAGSAEAVLTLAVTVGGDTDTIAAMATAMAGAHLGASALPQALLDRLESRTELVALADALAAIAG